MQIKSTLASLTILIWALGTTISYGQDKKPDENKSLFKSAGAIAISYHGDSESAYMSFGGPQIRFDYKNVGISYGVFPSVRLFLGDTKDASDLYRTKTVASPLLGTGLSVYYKKLAFVFPMYYLPTNNVWLVSFGIGYKM